MCSNRSATTYIYIYIIHICICINMYIYIYICVYMIQPSIYQQTYKLLALPCRHEYICIQYIYIYKTLSNKKKEDKIKWSLGWLGMDNGRPSPSIFDAFAMPAHKKWPRGIQPPQYHQRPIHAKWRTSRSSNPTSLALGARIMVVQTNSLKWISIKKHV